MKERRSSGWNAALVLWAPSLLTLDIWILQVVQALEMAFGFAVVDRVTRGLMRSPNDWCRLMSTGEEPCKCHWELKASHCYGCFVSSSWSTK